MATAKRRTTCPACGSTGRTRLTVPPHCPECGEAMAWSDRPVGRPPATPSDLLRRQAAELLELARRLDAEWGRKI